MLQWKLLWKSQRLRALTKVSRDPHFQKANSSSICGIKSPGPPATTGTNLELMWLSTALATRFWLLLCPLPLLLRFLATMSHLSPSLPISTHAVCFRVNLFAWTSTWCATWSAWTCGHQKSRTRLWLTMALCRTSLRFPPTSRSCTKQFGRSSRKTWLTWQSDAVPSSASPSHWICTRLTQSITRFPTCTSTRGEQASRQASTTLDHAPPVTPLNSL